MTSKVFGYQRFPSKLFELDTNEASKNETEKHLAEMIKNDPTLAEDESFMCRNNTYAVIPPVSVIYNTRAQTSLFRNIFLILQENNTKETYLECSFDHFKCKLTRVEHFIHDVDQIFTHSPKHKKKAEKDIMWLNENFVQRFYNGSMTFHEFADDLVKLFDFKSKTSSEMVNLCWLIYHREIFFRISANTLVTQLEDENLRKLFEIFTHLDNNVMCKVSPFLMNQFLTWWISESGFKLNKEVQSLAGWYESTPKDVNLDFPEFIKQVYRLFLSGTPSHIYKSLIIDAWECIVFGVIKKGLLEKVGPNKSRWLPRIMYLHMDRIEYFKKKTDGCLDSKGVIHLGAKSSVNEVFDEDKLGHYQIAVVCSESLRRFKLRADDQRIRHIWVTSIQNVLDVMKGATKPFVLEKPLKYVEDVGGELKKFRSASTNDSGVNTLNGNQLIFKRHSDDFSKHFQIDFSKKLPRSSSFTKVSPSLDILLNNPRISVTSKSSTLSEFADLTTSPHPGKKTVAFFNSFDSDKPEVPPLNPVRTDTLNSSNRSNSVSSCDEEYETMSNPSCTVSSGYITPNLSSSLGPSELNIFTCASDKHGGMTKSQTIDECLHTHHGSLESPEPIQSETSNLEIPAPIPAPRRKGNTHSPALAYNPEMPDPEAPKVPPRRIPRAPERVSSKNKFQHKNTKIVLSKIL